MVVTNVPALKGGSPGDARIFPRRSIGLKRMSRSVSASNSSQKEIRLRQIMDTTRVLRRARPPHKASGIQMFSVQANVCSARAMEPIFTRVHRLGSRYQALERPRTRPPITRASRRALGTTRVTRRGRAYDPRRGVRDAGGRTRD